MNEPGASIVHHPAETELFADTLTCDVALPASFETGSAATHPNAAEMMLRSIALVEDSRGDDDGERARSAAALSEVFEAVIELGGTLSGEHGIGLAKRDFMPRALDPEALDLMRRLKGVFDPDGILNPGKLLP